MTRKEAEDLVEELLQALVDFENCQGFEKKYYREDYLKLKERVIAALTSG